MTRVVQLIAVTCQRVAVGLVVVAGGVLSTTLPAGSELASPTTMSAPFVHPHIRQIEPMVAPLPRKIAIPRVAAAQGAIVVAKAQLPPQPIKVAAQPEKAVTAKGAPAPGRAKFVAYTCKLGQEYSVERKTCYTPGVNIDPAAPTAAVEAKTAVVKAAGEGGGRSALGANQRR
jgi:hypothetical protein